MTELGKAIADLKYVLEVTGSHLFVDGIDSEFNKITISIPRARLEALLNAAEKIRGEEMNKTGTPFDILNGVDRRIAVEMAMSALYRATHRTFKTYGKNNSALFFEQSLENILCLMLQDYTEKRKMEIVS